MRYMILIHRNPSFWSALSESERAELSAAYTGYVSTVREAGVLVAADQLQGAATAKIVSDERVVDGPYADTKEELGGYFLIEVPTEADAIAWARRCPGARYGDGVELRPTVAR